LVEKQNGLICSHATVGQLQAISIKLVYAKINPFFTIRLEQFILRLQGDQG